MDSDGKYYASILVDTFEQPLPKSPVSEDTTIGIDSGLNTLKFLRQLSSKITREKKDC